MGRRPPLTGSNWLRALGNRRHRRQARSPWPAQCGPFFCPALCPYGPYYRRTRLSARRWLDVGVVGWRVIGCVWGALAAMSGRDRGERQPVEWVSGLWACEICPVLSVITLFCERASPVFSRGQTPLPFHSSAPHKPEQSSGSHSAISISRGIHPATSRRRCADVASEA